MKGQDQVQGQGYQKGRGLGQRGRAMRKHSARSRGCTVDVCNADMMEMELEQYAWRRSPSASPPLGGRDSRHSVVSSRCPVTMHTLDSHNTPNDDPRDSLNSLVHAATGNGGCILKAAKRDTTVAGAANSTMLKGVNLHAHKCLLEKHNFQDDPSRLSPEQNGFHQGRRVSFADEKIVKDNGS